MNQVGIPSGEGITTIVVPERLTTDSKQLHIKPLEITVLMGGPSAEREVSLNSGKAVAHALRSLGHDVRPADISPDNLAALSRSADLVFIALHGTFGEDGQLQAILESRAIPFVGSGSVASRLAMNKADSKARFLEAGLPTPQYQLVHGNSPCDTLKPETYPVVVKPNEQGSSVDTFIAEDPRSLRTARDHVIQQYGSCLIEEYIGGAELTVSILGRTALPLCEIRTTRQFYDYVAKYADDDTRYLFEPDLPVDLIERVQELSLQAHHALGCEDFSRVDWRLDPKTLDPYLLEVNTIPGFTDHSLLPKAAARAGISFPRLCQEIIALALGRTANNGRP